MTNVNPETGIPYGYIRADSLHPDVVDELQRGADLHYEEACLEMSARIANAVDDFLSSRSAISVIEHALELFDHEDDEPVHEGEYEQVHYRTSWLGGALHVWVFSSPVTGHYQKCSPCVPGAGNLDCPDLDGIVCYDVPADWRVKE